MSKPEPKSYFYVLTLQKSAPYGMAIRTVSGVATPDPECTANEFYQEVRNALESKYPDVVGGNVMTFVLQPNQL